MMAEERRVWQQIGRVLWSICEVERGGARVAKLLHDGIGLTAPERARLERTMEEEALHMRLIREVALELRPRPPRADSFQTLIWRDLAVLAHVDERTRFAWALAVTQWNERFSVRKLADWARVFQILHPDLAARFGLIRSQELGHVAWGDAVIARVRSEEPTVARTFDEMYRTTRRVYPPVITASHWAAFQAAARLAGQPVTHD